MARKSLAPVGVAGFALALVALLLPLLVVIAASIPGLETVGYLIILAVLIAMGVALLGLVLSLIAAVAARRERPVVAILGIAISAGVLILCMLFLNGEFMTPPV